jgi:ABC-2 type transport system ATP-binding protein
VFARVRTRHASVRAPRTDYGIVLRVQPNAAISLSGLTKRYGRLTAVHNLDVEAKEGEVLGFLGLNGAGKTTTIRILLDLLRPTSGRACIFGYDCQAQGLQARSLVGYLPGELGIYSDLTGREVLDLLAGLNGRPVGKHYRLKLQERLDFPDSVLHRKLREYSTGMKRKLGLIQAFQADPRLLILDEPTEGLDPLMQESFYELIAEVRQRGRTVFMSSHVLSEVDRVCDRIAILRKGELVLFSTIEEARSVAARRVRVFFAGDVNLPATLPPGHEIVDIKPRVWNLRVEGELGPLLSLLATLPVKDMQVEQPRLEDVLVKYYREDVP